LFTHAAAKSPVLKDRFCLRPIVATAGADVQFFYLGVSGSPKFTVVVGAIISAPIARAVAATGLAEHPALAIWLAVRA